MHNLYLTNNCFVGVCRVKHPYLSGEFFSRRKGELGGGPLEDRVFVRERRRFSGPRWASTVTITRRDVSASSFIAVTVSFPGGEIVKRQPKLRTPISCSDGIDDNNNPAVDRNRHPPQLFRRGRRISPSFSGTGYRNPGKLGNSTCRREKFSAGILFCLSGNRQSFLLNPAASLTSSARASFLLASAPPEGLPESHFGGSCSKFR